MVFERLGTFIVECKRVLNITKKPNKEEFLAIFKVAGLGLLIIGLMGFIIFILEHYLF